MVVPAPVPPPWPAAGSGCDARTHWVYQYDHTYQGQVYALLARPDATPTDTTVTLTWGAWRWRHPVTVQPGTPERTTGGTLLLYVKLDTSLRDPLVTLDTPDPVCAAFGTAGPTSVAPLSTVDANQGWTGAEPTADTPAGPDGPVAMDSTSGPSAATTGDAADRWPSAGPAHRFVLRVGRGEVGVAAGSNIAGEPVEPRARPVQAPRCSSHRQRRAELRTITAAQREDNARPARGRPGLRAGMVAVAGPSSGEGVHRERADPVGQ
ncbi:hypothetical protein ACFC6U_27805 [Kitasatospora purpeofusca]|uniref:hypothetical protein n=1 Tax=Kitasatospora purpeofusca TaxID=67352 RepID=UPI0035D5DE4A